MGEFSLTPAGTKIPSQATFAELPDYQHRSPAGDASRESDLPQWGDPCVGEQVYAPRYRAEWLAKIGEAGMHRRAEFYYRQFNALRSLRQEVRRELLAETQKHNA